MSTIMFFESDHQKWLRNSIPKAYVDVDYLIEDLVFKSLVYFWENGGDDAIYSRYDLFNDESRNVRDELNLTQIELINEKRKAWKIYFELKDAYRWAISRKEKESQLDNIVGINDSSINRKQQFIDMDTKHLNNIIKWRKHLWD